MKHFITLTLCLSTLLYGYSQNYSEYIAKNAIEISDDLKLTNAHYESFEGFKLIMMGEMHGTKEPAIFVRSLAENILKKENSVSIGLEIPHEEMKEFIASPSDSTLRASRFFSKENYDGRNGQAWFDLIKYCITEPKINLFFFDNYMSMEIKDRDSAMYIEVIQHMNDYPESKVITLSGNIHNWLIPFNTAETMGTYCLSDTLMFPKGSICSINHTYSQGTMMNNSGNGLELTTIEFEESILSEATNFKNYLVFYNSKTHSNNCILYTKSVSYSPVLE